MEWLPAFLEPPAARLIAQIAGGAILLGLIGLVLALASYLRVKATWIKTNGRIIASSPGFDLRQRFKTEAPRNERVAKIGYEFEAAGKTWRSGKILDSGHPPEDQVDRLLADYPTGKSVTVLYNPRDPAQSALEIDHPPKDLALGCLAAVAIVVVLAAVAIWLVGPGLGQLKAWFPNALLQLMIPTALVGIIFVLLFVFTRRHAAEMVRWPTVTGTIVFSRVEAFTVRRDKPKRTLRGSRRMRDSFMPVVEYRYSVGGKELSSRSIWADTEVSGDRAYAEGIAARYKPGAVVFVRYDPADPKRAALEPPGSGHWFFLAGAVVFLAAAAASSGMLF